MRGQLQAQVARLDVSSAPPAEPTISLGPMTAMANDPSKSQNAKAAPFIALDTETPMNPNESSNHSGGHPHNFPGPLTEAFTTPGDIVETLSSQPTRMQCEGICAGMLPLSHYSEQTLSSMRWHDFNAKATGRGGTVWACRECKASIVRVEEMRVARFCANCHVHLTRDNTSRAQLARTRGRARCLTCVARHGLNGASTS